MNCWSENEKEGVNRTGSREKKSPSFLFVHLFGVSFALIPAPR